MLKISIKDLKHHYRFGENEAMRLKVLQPLAEANMSQFSETLLDYIRSISETEEIMRNHNASRLAKMHEHWFMSLFEGEYDEQYFNELKRVGQVHVKIGLNAHFVNSAMNQIRHFLLNLIDSSYRDREERRLTREAVEKILDINLDIMTSSYREEEMRKVFLSREVEGVLLKATERFTYGLNLILVLALVGVSITAVLLFVWDIAHILQGDMEKAILSALGSLLIIWMMIELLSNEIKNLKGGKFNILVFIGVIIVALIREILISTLRHDKLETQVFLAGTLLILGIVYYLVSKSKKDLPED